jgi:hypothetical protein
MSRLTQAFDAIRETGVLELIGINEQVDQNEYCNAVIASLPSGQPMSGEILHVTLYTRETGSGAVLTPAGILYILDADPAVAAGATLITATVRRTVIAQIPIAAADWKSDAGGASVSVHNKPVAFHALKSLYFLWFHEDATSFNDAGGDDEILEVNAWYRRDT